ncbi:hypothetical protein E2C01_010879 [Portunus trituberculatus]|uniref:Uncharacterized protein n=1 Tax=Portunus trituberculatus TaxID=210409 RepID=A0A5B7D9J8_PORTR|nr:hypothetical protein [Portunus trituberculatus]
MHENVILKTTAAQLERRRERLRSFCLQPHGWTFDSQVIDHHTLAKSLWQETPLQQLKQDSSGPFQPLISSKSHAFIFSL